MNKLWWWLWQRPSYDPTPLTITWAVLAATAGIPASYFLLTTVPVTVFSMVLGSLIALAVVIIYRQALREGIWWYGIRTGKVKPRPLFPPALPAPQYRQLGITEHEYTVELLDHRFGGHWGTDTTGPKTFYPSSQAAHEWAVMLSKVYGAENVRVRAARIHYEEVSPERAPVNE